MVRSTLPPRGVPRISLAQKAGLEERGNLNSARRQMREENRVLLSRRNSTDEMKDRPGRQVNVNRRAGGELGLKNSDT
eukprot:5238803-Prymnesium_polylepis.1